MSRRDTLRLTDIADAIATIRSHRDLAAADPKAVSDAILYQLIVIGEAANGLSEGARSSASGVDWRAIIALRNRLAHAYWQVSLDVIDEILEHDLGDLEASVRELLAASDD